MKVNMYQWTLIEKNSTLRQGVTSAKKEKEAIDYLLASFTKEEIDLYKSSSVNFKIKPIFYYKDF